MTSARRTSTIGFGLLAVATAAALVGQIPGSAGAQSEAASCAGHRATIVGTHRADVIIGTAGRDLIQTGVGNDVIRGRGGDDLICAHKGDDRVSGGSGGDEVHGRGGDDRLLGGLGQDVLLGEFDDDRLDGGSGRDACRTGPGYDVERGCES